MDTGTIEQALPGLETMTPQTELDLGRAIALSPQKRLMLFSGRSNPELAQRIAEQLDIELGRRTELDFFNGVVIARGRALGIPTPWNESVLALARSIERGELKPALANLERLPR